jgi:predicted nucleic acid-binding protein
MTPARIKIILDVDCYIQAAIHAGFRRSLYYILKSNRFAVYYSNDILEEATAVISRPCFQNVLSLSQWQRMMGLVLPRLNNIGLDFAGAANPYLVEFTMSCCADFLITSDTALLSLEQIGETKVVSLSNFMVKEFM